MHLYVDNLQRQSVGLSIYKRYHGAEILCTRFCHASCPADDYYLTTITSILMSAATARIHSLTRAIFPLYPSDPLRRCLASNSHHQSREPL